MAGSGRLRRGASHGRRIGARCESSPFHEFARLLGAREPPWVLDGAHWLINLVETTGAQDDPDWALTLLTAASQSPWAVLVEIAAVCGLILGPVLLAVGLWRRRATPISAPITCCSKRRSPSSPEARQWRTSSQALAVVSSALLAIVLTGLALRILSLPDEAWARWATAAGCTAASADFFPDGRGAARRSGPQTS